VFSQYIETRYAANLLVAASGGGAAGVGYLLKDRVADVEEFVEALSRVAAGGTALDPEVVTQLLRASRRTDGLGTLTARERDVLALMAEGRSNAAIAGILVVSEKSVEKHVGNIFSKLGLPPLRRRPPPGARRPPLPGVLTGAPASHDHWQQDKIKEGVRVIMARVQNTRPDLQGSSWSG